MYNPSQNTKHLAFSLPVYFHVPIHQVRDKQLF